ncbi:helix-turn-helix transcriptional regulator [Odoribacter lunatus]|uniref:helix-turn-helix transcriptional regulator n=1 Tax=Odoribacter lunatus TaxID=2941335 RepID=UPI0020417FB0|nr:WYL domain-containing protein [Odoribacter lunatus]
MFGLKEIQRALIIIRKVRAYKGITLKELQEKIKEELTFHGYTNIAISDRTLQRDIQGLRKLGIHISYSRLKGYHFPEDEEQDPENVEAVLEAFDLLNALGGDTGMNHFVFPSRRPYRGREHLHTLLKMIKKNASIRIRYKKYEEDDITEREIYPYALKEWRSRWYLLGIIKGKDPLTTFGLDRILDIQELSKAPPKKEIDINAMFHDCCGIYNDEEIQAEEVIISYNTWDGEYVKSQPIHHSQEVLPNEKDKDRLFFKLKVKITGEFQLEILARGFSLQVHKPESLREAIYKIYQNGMKANEFGKPLLF